LPERRRWLNITLRGTKSNRSAIGTVVTAVTGTKRQRRDVDGGSGFCSQPSLPVEFGFGQTTTVDSLIIRWPSGIVQVLTNVATNQFLTVTEKGTPGLVTAVGEDEDASGAIEGQRVPTTYTLSQNVPNPFNPETIINFELPEVAEIRLSVTNLAGQEVRVLVQGVHQPGQYRVVWDGRDTTGQDVASGVYLYRLEVVGRGIVETKRMALVR